MVIASFFLIRPSIQSELDNPFVLASRVQYVTAEWKPAFLRQAREFLFFPLLPREASK